VCSACPLLGSGSCVRKSIGVYGLEFMSCRLWVLSGIGYRAPGRLRPGASHVSTCTPAPDLGLETGRGDGRLADMAWRVERAIRGLRAIFL